MWVGIQISFFCFPFIVFPINTDITSCLHFMCARACVHHQIRRSHCKFFSHLTHIPWTQISILGLEIIASQPHMIELMWKNSITYPTTLNCVCRNCNRCRTHVGLDWISVFSVGLGCDGISPTHPNPTKRTENQSNLGPCHRVTYITYTCSMES